MESLNQITGNLINNYVNQAAKHNSFFVNDIPRTLTVEFNQSWVRSVISNLLTTIVQHTRDTCIRLTARQYGYVLVLEVRESGSINGYAMACDLQESNAMAEKIGGCLSISVQDPMVTVAFSFPDLPAAA
jgi:signal transduction histidine kinase